MLYRFICPKCRNTTEINVSSDEIKDQRIVCGKCNELMRRDWRASMFAADSDKASNIEDTSYLNSIMDTRPSGKTRSIY